MVIAGSQGGRGRTRELNRQWDFVSDLPIFINAQSRLTWKDLCAGEKQSKQCLRFYRYERDRMRALGRISESSKNIVTEDRVIDICDWRPYSIALIINNPKIQRENFVSPRGKKCGLRRLTEYAQVGRQ